MTPTEGARDANDATTDLARRQNDIATFFDKATGAIREQNAALIQNARLKRLDSADEQRARASSIRAEIEREVRRSNTPQTFATSGLAAEAGARISVQVAFALGGPVGRWEARWGNRSLRAEDDETAARSAYDGAPK